MEYARGAVNTFQRKMEDRVKELSGSLIIYAGVPALLILVMEAQICQYAMFPGLNILLPPWIHYGDQFLWGNIKGFLLTFPVLMIVSSRTRSLLPTMAAILVLWPLFSFISQAITGGYNPGSWGFSGYLYAIYGAVVYFTLLGAGQQLQRPAVRVAVVSLISVVAVIPLLCTPAILHIGAYTYYIGTRVHLLGFVFGLLMPALVQYPDLRSNRLWVLGVLAVIMEWWQFAHIIPYL